jgi:hypothetical protein
MREERWIGARRLRPIRRPNRAEKRKFSKPGEFCARLRRRIEHVFRGNSFDVHYCISDLRGKPGERRRLVVERRGARRAVDASVTAFD